MPIKDPEARRIYQNGWRTNRRKEWFDEHGPCVSCGSWENLELDHKDRSTKVSHRVWSWSKERREAELAKCQVLCHDCHLVKTNLDFLSSDQHGTSTMYENRGCRCEECRAYESNRNKNRRTINGVRTRSAPA